jgi:2-methylcitrate dehydratase
MTAAETQHRDAPPGKAVDSIQQTLTNYACALSYSDLTAETIEGAKLRIIDTLGALIGGFFGEPSRLVRDFAARSQAAEGSSILGTGMKARPELAAFVNGTTARFPEMTDSYHWPGSSYGHPSDVIMPTLAVAEHVHASGRDFILGVVLAYENYLRMSNAFHNAGFDHTNFCLIGSAIAAGKLLALNPEQLAHCISMAVVPNIVLRQVRTDPLSMWKAVASGQAGRAGVFAALLAEAGMEGPHLPFEGKAGFSAHVAREPIVLETMGGHGAPFKILDTRIKLRPSSGEAQSAILAAEKVAPVGNVDDVKQVFVETYKKAKLTKATGAHQWNPDTHETADHSLPYLIAAALIDGTVTLRSFNDAHLWNPKLRALMQKIEVVENEDYTKAYEKRPVEHRTRVTITTMNGSKRIGEAGGDEYDMTTPKSPAQVEAKFRALAEDALGSARVRRVLDALWSLDALDDVRAIAPMVNFES